MTKKPIRKPINVDIKIHKEIKELAFIEDIPIIELTRKMVKNTKKQLYHYQFTRRLTRSYLS